MNSPGAPATSPNTGPSPAPPTSEDASGWLVELDGGTKVVAAQGSELRLTSESFFTGASSTSSAKISAGKGSYLRLGADSEVEVSSTTTVKKKKTGLGTTLVVIGLLAGLIAGLAMASLASSQAGSFVLTFGILTFVCVFIKEACTTLSKETSYSKARIDWLVKTAAIASIFVVVFGTPTAAVTIAKAYSVASVTDETPAESTTSTPTP